MSLVRPAYNWGKFLGFTGVISQITTRTPPPPLTGWLVPLLVGWSKVTKTNLGVQVWSHIQNWKNLQVSRLLKASAHTCSCFTPSKTIVPAWKTRGNPSTSELRTVGSQTPQWPNHEKSLGIFTSGRSLVLCALCFFACDAHLGHHLSWGTASVDSSFSTASITG